MISDLSERLTLFALGSSSAVYAILISWWFYGYERQPQYQNLIPMQFEESRMPFLALRQEENIGRQQFGVPPNRIHHEV